LSASQSEDDLKVTSDIRSAMRSDNTLSPRVNELVSIATNGKAVVLAGALPSTGDIDRVTALAGLYAGARQIVNQLTLFDPSGPAASLDRRR
jgi:osmotically-inducible protein OsmY